MRVVFFLQGKQVPAARFRGFAIASALAQRGLATDIRVPVPSVYGDLQSLRLGRWRPLLKPIAFLARLAQVSGLQKDDIVFFQRPMVELPTTLLERWCAKGRASIFDFDDAIYLNWRGRAKMRSIIDMVDQVIVGNQHLAEEANVPAKTTVIPTVVDTDRYPDLPCRPTKGREVVVGWTGLSCNYPHLAVAAGPISSVLRKTGARFRIISDRAPPSNLACLNAEFIPWSSLREIEDLSGLDIGVMPLFDGPWERGKCAFKLIQYMALARAGMASPVGANREVVTHGSDGFLPTSDAEWEDQLVALIENPELRNEMGRKARTRICKKYSILAVLPQIEGILTKLALGRSHG